MTCKVLPPWGLVFWGFWAPKSWTHTASEARDGRGLRNHLASVSHLTDLLLEVGGDWPQVPLLSQIWTVSSVAFFYSSPNFPCQPGQDLGPWKPPVTSSDHEFVLGGQMSGEAAVCTLAEHFESN